MAEDNNNQDPYNPTGGSKHSSDYSGVVTALALIALVSVVMFVAFIQCTGEVYHDLIGQPGGNSSSGSSGSSNIGKMKAAPPPRSELTTARYTSGSNIGKLVTPTPHPIAKFSVGQRVFAFPPPVPYWDELTNCDVNAKLPNSIKYPDALGVPEYVRMNMPRAGVQYYDEGLVTTREGAKYARIFHNLSLGQSLEITEVSDCLYKGTIDIKWYKVDAGFYKTVWVEGSKLTTKDPLHD